MLRVILPGPNGFHLPIRNETDPKAYTEIEDSCNSYTKHPVLKYAGVGRRILRRSMSTRIPHQRMTGADSANVHDLKDIEGTIVPQLQGRGAP